MRKLTYVVAAVIVSAITIGAQAHPFAIDQSNDALGFDIRRIQLSAPMGQEFTPAFSALDVVEVITLDDAPDNGIGADLFVNIRQGAITGPIIGTSLTVSLPDHFGMPRPPLHVDPPGGITHFDFPSAVPLVPGGLYVLEVVVAAGDDWALSSSDELFGLYSGGRAIFSGMPQTALDFVFWEGPARVIPEPGSITLIGLGGLSLVVHGGCQRQRRRT